MKNTGMQFHTEVLTAADGGRFALTRVHPTGSLRGAVVYVPGMFSGPKGVGLAADLAAAGYAG